MILKSIMYHYVRNPETTPYKGIHAVREEDFITQVKFLKEHYEMATAESIRDFLNGTYIPKKNLAVMTFDDGLKEHGYFVTEVLAQHGIQGQFFIPTACQAEGYVLPVHKNHFLLASLDFAYYQSTCIAVLKQYYPEQNIAIDQQKVADTYRWDSPEVAALKYLLNYHLPRPVRNEVLRIVFEQELGPETEFAKSLYLSWDEIRNMQDQGMIIGGHSHRHNVLAHLSDQEQEQELDTCMTILKQHVHHQDVWPFSYPFGKLDTFNNLTLSLLEKNNVAYAYSTVVDDSMIGTNKYNICRRDPKDIKAKELTD